MDRQVQILDSVADMPEGLLFGTTVFLTLATNAQCTSGYTLPFRPRKVRHVTFFGS